MISCGESCGDSFYHFPSVVIRIRSSVINLRLVPGWAHTLISLLLMQCVACSLYCLLLTLLRHLHFRVSEPFANYGLQQLVHRLSTSMIISDICSFESLLHIAVVCVNVAKPCFLCLHFWFMTYPVINMIQDQENHAC